MDLEKTPGRAWRVNEGLINPSLGTLTPITGRRLWRRHSRSGLFRAELPVFQSWELQYQTLASER